MSALLVTLVLPAWADPDPPAEAEAPGTEAPERSDSDDTREGDSSTREPEDTPGDDDSEEDGETPEDDAEEEDSEEEDQTSEEDEEEDSGEDETSEDDAGEDGTEGETDGPEPEEAETDAEPGPLLVRPEAPMRGAFPERHRRARRIRREGRGTMRPNGLLQVFTTVWDQDESVQADPASYGDPEADPGFQLARARFGFDGRLPQRPGAKSSVDYALIIGVGTPFDALRLGTQNVGFVDAMLRYTARPTIGVSTASIGLAKVPFSRELLMSSQDLLFQERAVGPENLTSTRDVGLTLGQSIKLGSGQDVPQIVLRGGLYNGNADFLGDNDPGLMYALRAELAKGDTYRTWSPENANAYGVGGAVLLDDGLTTRTFAWTADGLVRLGPWSLYGEYARASLTPTDVTAGPPEVVTDTTRTAWAAGTSVFAKLKGGRQGVEIGARASAFDDNTRLDDNGDVLVIHAGATWRDALPFFDLGAGFIHREELQGTPISNDTIRIWTQIRPRR